MLNVNVRGLGRGLCGRCARRHDTDLALLPAGRHTVEIVNGATGERQTRVVTIIPNQTTRVTF